MIFLFYLLVQPQWFGLSVNIIRVANSLFSEGIWEWTYRLRLLV